MTAADPPSPDASPSAPDDGWQPLPRRARPLFVIGNLFAFGVPAIFALIPIGTLAPSRTLALVLAIAVLALLPAWGVWLALKQHACTRWRLDDDGFALRRGRLWQQETRVPASRVQHLDIRRGPLERRFGLSTLVIHTAGTRQSSVSTAGLDAADAEALRDRLARRVETDDDA